MTTIFTLNNAAFTAPGLPVLKTVEEFFTAIPSLMAWHKAEASRVSDNGTTYSLSSVNASGLPLHVEHASAPTIEMQSVNGVDTPVLNLINKRLLWDGEIQGAGRSWTIVSAIKLTHALAASDYLFRSKEDGFGNNFWVSSSNGTNTSAWFETNGPTIGSWQPPVGEWVLAKIGLTAAGTLWVDFNNGEKAAQTNGLSYADCPQGLVVGGRFASTNNNNADMYLGEQFVFSSDVRSLPEYSELNAYMTSKWLS